MALRPFAKHQKRKADDDTTPSAADEFAQFFSNDPRPDEPLMDEGQPPPVEQPAPAVTMTEASAAGWYPDSDDPGLMRYWDGFHLTGQTMRVDPPRPATPEAGQARTAVAPGEPSVAQASSAADLLALHQPKPPLLGSQLLSSTTDDAVPPPPASAPVEPEPSEAQVDVPVATEQGDEPPANADNPTVAPAPAPAPVAPSMTRLTSPVAPAAPKPAGDSWAVRTEQAVVKAQAVGTPEAWQEAARAAAVVSEMALTMQVAADVRQSAGQLEEAAEEAKRKAEEAGERAAQAQTAVQETARAARQAADAAAAASRAATEAKQKAEQATEAMPRIAAQSNEAAQAAAAAKRKAQLLDEIVTKAHRTDTSEAWSEAHRSAEQALERPAQGAPVAGS